MPKIRDGALTPKQRAFVEIFVKIKIYFFYFKNKILYGTKVIHNYLQLILFSPLLSHVYIIKDN